MLRPRSCFTFALCLVAAQAAPARAQEPGGQPLETIAVQTLGLAETPSTAEKDATPVQLDVVVVKGEKLGRKLSETTSSVSVFSGMNLADRCSART